MGYIKIFIKSILLASILLFTSFIVKDSSKPVDIGSLLKNFPSFHEEMIADYWDFLSSELDTTNSVGAAVVIVSHDSVIFRKTYGIRKVGEPDLIDLNTVFRLASVSKGFAGVLASMLDEKNILDIDQSIISILPGFQLKDSINTNDLKLLHTLNHTSGIVPHAYDNLVEANIPMKEIISRFKDVDIAAPPGEVYGYQNAIYSLIDTILKVKTGDDYNLNLKKYIFDPLGMNTASSDFGSMTNNDNIAYPHAYCKKGYCALKLNDGYYNVAPAAGVNASINDMTLWLKALLGYRTGIIDTNVINKISSPTIYTPLKRRYTYHWGKVDSRHYSIGWRIYNYLGKDIVYHGGYVKGYKAEIAFCPELRTGIVFLQNSPNRVASKSIPEFWKRYFKMISETDLWAEL